MSYNPYSSTSSFVKSRTAPRHRYQQTDHHENHLVTNIIKRLVWKVNYFGLCSGKVMVMCTHGPFLNIPQNYHFLVPIHEVWMKNKAGFTFTSVHGGVLGVPEPQTARKESNWAKRLIETINEPACLLTIILIFFPTTLAALYCLICKFL